MLPPVTNDSSAMFSAATADNDARVWWPLHKIEQWYCWSSLVTLHITAQLRCPLGLRLQLSLLCHESVTRLVKLHLVLSLLQLLLLDLELDGGQQGGLETTVSHQTGH